MRCPIQKTREDRTAWMPMLGHAAAEWRELKSARTPQERSIGGLLPGFVPTRPDPWGKHIVSPYVSMCATSCPPAGLPACLPACVGLRIDSRPRPKSTPTTGRLGLARNARPLVGRRRHVYYS